MKNYYLELSINELYQVLHYTQLNIVSLQRNNFIKPIENFKSKERALRQNLRQIEQAIKNKERRGK